ncbi:MAG: cysteine desulfurase-like protein [Planctomycetota bacterium]|nr:cysteine desulfurase-like protein [Planctomycetota bacterium]
MGDFETTMVDYCRRQFPALQREEKGRPAAFLDGPAGTQVPLVVIEAMTRYFTDCNANEGGLFGTSRQSDHWLHEAHQAFADLIGAEDPDEIIFGQNMTSLTYAFSRALARTWNAGDEIIVTALDHDANISPWVQAAADRDVVVHWVDFNSTDYMLELDQLEKMLSDKTRLVAVGCASNATGGINPVKEICTMAHQTNALVYLDAVHFGPHGLIDVADWDCDFLACSSYKFFGPHLGTLWGRRKLLEEVAAYKVRPASNQIPGKWMTGTPSHESIVGGMACIDYLADIGRQVSGQENLPRRKALELAFQAINEYENALTSYLLEGLARVPGVKVYGITEPSQLERRFSTVSITHEAIQTTELAQRLADAGIYVWHGNYYALEFTHRLGLEPEGMVRIGLVHYNTFAEIDRLLEVVSNAAVAS